MREHLRSMIGRRVIVICDQMAISGTLSAVAKDGAVTLEGPTAHHETRPDAPVDGVAIIPAATIGWVQIP